MAETVVTTNTGMNRGIRRNFAVFGDRNFETSGTVQYVAERDQLWFLSTKYARNATLPFDVGGTHYSATAMAQLELYWNNGWIKPLV